MTHTTPAIRHLRLFLTIPVLFFLCSACTRFMFVTPEYLLDRPWEHYQKWPPTITFRLVEPIPHGGQTGISVSGGATFGQWTAGSLPSTTTVQLSSIAATMGNTMYKMTDLKVHAGSGPLTFTYPSLPTNPNIGAPIAVVSSFNDPYSDLVEEDDIVGESNYVTAHGKYWVRVVIHVDANGVQKRLVAAREFTLNIPYPQNVEPFFPINTFDQFYWEY